MWPAWRRIACCASIGGRALSRSPSEPMLFTEHYYREVIAEFGHTPFDLRRFDFTLAGLDAGTLNARYLCHQDAGCFVRTPTGRRVVSTGFGMSGVPHMATVSHILKM